MAGPDDEREDRPEDLFEDLDKYFAPIKDSDWPEGEGASAEAPPAAPPPTGSDVEALDDWGELDIDLPDEQELAPSPAAGFDDPEIPEDAPLEAAPHEAETPAAAADDLSQTASFEMPVDEPAGATPVAAEHPDEAMIGAEPASGPGEEWLFESEEGESDDWDRFRRSLGGPEEAPATPAAEPVDAGTAVLKPPPAYEELAAAGPDAPLEPAQPTTEPAEPADVEAAAEHFAASVRGSPEEVERELLADLDEPAGDTPGTIRVETLGADLETPPPAWEQPTIGGPEDLERPTGAAGRNLPAAVISGALLAIGAVALLAIGNGPFAFLAAVVVVIGQGELYAVLKARGAQPATALGLVVGVLMIVGGYLRGESAILFGLFLAMALSVLWYMAAPPQARRQVAQNVAATLLGVVYVPFLASFAVVILRTPVVGRNLLLTVLGLTVLYDVCAYAIGSLWGSRPLAPTVSPKKSWEGAVGATFVLLLVALAIVPSVDPFTAAKAVGLALVLAIAAPVGDLIESALKRDLRVKDMGSILPGHGGILDRIDSILLAAPAAYYFLLLTA